MTAEQVRAAHAVHPIAAVQHEYSLWTRGPERELLPAAGASSASAPSRGRRSAPASSPASADRIGSPGEDFRTNHPRFRAENLAANRDRYAPLRGLAEELGITPAQLALAWIVAQGRIVPIPSTRTPAHLDENLAAADVELDDATLARIDELAPAGAAAGGPGLALLEPHDHRHRGDDHRGARDGDRGDRLVEDQPAEEDRDDRVHVRVGGDLGDGAFWSSQA